MNFCGNPDKKIFTNLNSMIVFNLAMTYMNFRCGSIGTTDARAFIDGLEANISLTELDFSSNDISDKLGFAKGMANTLMVRNEPRHAKTCLMTYVNICRTIKAQISLRIQAV